MMVGEIWPPVASYWRQWRLILALRLRIDNQAATCFIIQNPDVIVIKGGNTVKIHRLPLSVKRKVVMKPARVPQTVVAPDRWGDLPQGRALSQGAGAPAQPVVH